MPTVLRRPLAWAVTGMLVATLAACGGTSTPDGDETSASAPDPRTALVGTWTLARLERHDQRGDPLPAFVHPDIGLAAAAGALLYDGERVSLIVQAADRPARVGETATPEDALAAVDGYTAYYGSYAVNATAGVVTHRIAGSLNPRLTGGETELLYELTGDQLVLTAGLQCPDSFVTDAGCGYGTTGIRLRYVWDRVAGAATGGDDVARPFYGFWEVARVERQVVGDAAAAPGEAIPTAQYAGGYLVYMPSGQMAVQLMRPDRDRYAGPRPTAAEADAAMRSYASYFGPFTVRPDEGVVVHHRIGHLDPLSVGVDARRGYTFRDDQLVLEPPAATVDGRTVQTRVVWTRRSTLGVEPTAR